MITAAPSSGLPASFWTRPCGLCVLTSNIVKCRPKGNRTPDLSEADFCAKIWLERELAILQPKVIVALGSVAMHYLGDPDMRITRQRGKWFKTAQGYDCIATFHPSYILRQYGHAQVQAKWDVYHDLQLARAKAVEACPDYNLCSDKPVNLFAEFKKRNGNPLLMNRSDFVSKGFFYETMISLFR